jgi:AcrR family transcriptional regulator
MMRPRSDEKRSAILEATTRIIVMQDLSAPTAGIAKEAGVANGSLFTYFETKADLFNQLYLELKSRVGIGYFEKPSGKCGTARAVLSRLAELDELGRCPTPRSAEHLHNS